MASVGKEWAAAAAAILYLACSWGGQPAQGQAPLVVQGPDAKNGPGHSPVLAPEVFNLKDARVFPRMADSKGESVRVRQVPPDLPLRHITIKPGVAGSGARRAAGATDCTGVESYRNTQGELFLVPAPGILIADDVQLACAAAGRLTCYEFTVYGGGDGTGPGFSLNFAMYTGCPAAGGQLIAGTSDTVTLDDDGAWVVTLDLADGPVQVPEALWLATSNYLGAAAGVEPGWVFGTPAEVGLSEDNFHHPSFPCNSWFGGWPDHPHASFNARVFLESCAPSHVGYLSDAFSGIFYGGQPGQTSADDVTPISAACQMSRLQVDYAGLGGPYSAQIDLRQDSGGVPGAVIAGTARTFNGAGDGTLEARVFDFDPPVVLPQRFWISHTDDDGDAGPVVAGAMPRIGTSADSIAIQNGVNWDFMFFGGCTGAADNPCGSFNMRIDCLGEAPSGACCDVLASELCAEDVPAVACAGRFAPAETCATADFDPPCGAAACCLGNGNCVNLTATECGLGAGFWQPGEFCGLAGQACPLEACIGATGSCLQPHTTPACDDPLCCDEICQADDFCCLVEWDETCVSAALVVGLCTADIAPENDDFADALPLAAGMTPFNTVGASTDGPNYAGDPDCGPFGDDTVHQDIWYEYQAACSGQLTVTTCSDLGGSAGFDTRLAIQDGCASVQDPALACNDDDPQHPCGSAPSFQSTLTVAVTAGECYAVRVGGFQTGNAGSGTLNVTENLVNCGCPNTAVTFMDPPSGVVDARQPHQPDNPGAALGIDRMVVQASADVADTVCWSLCESSTLGPPNSITAVTDNGNGTFTVQLARPITANAVTKLRYTASGAVGTFTSHPANINGDSTSGPQDLLALIDSLNGAANLPWGLYSGDVDHSGVVNGQDIIAVIDLLNGAGAFEPWNGSALPDGGACP